MAPGSMVKFIDRDEKEHIALVIHAWQTSLNIAYVGGEEDSFGKVIVRETSVPWFEEGMKGFYIKDPGF